MNASQLLPRLHGVKPNGKGWMALCPAHDDHSPSLSINESEDGRVLVNCFADCSPEQVCAAVGIALRELGPNENRPTSTSPRQTTSKSRRLVATYEYIDEEGKLLFQVLRYEPKQFWQRRPDEKGGWVYNLNGTRRVLYHLPDILRADQSAMVFIVEGEKDAERLGALGFVATTSPGGAGKWRKDYAEVLRDRLVCVLPDNDPPGSRHAQAVANSLVGEGASVRILLLPNLPDKGDVSNWLDAGGTGEALQSLAVSQPLHEPESSQTESPRAESDEELLQRLASLPLLEYEREREPSAKTLGCRTTVLDKLVQSERCQRQPSDVLQGHALDLGEVDPWPESVNGAEVLNQVSEAFSDYIVLPDGAADVLALWCAHAHVFDVFVCSPRLNITSPDKRCGKTTLRDVLAVFVPRPLPTETLTSAVLFRVVESHKPILLADEYDAWLSDNEELRGLLNAGHGRTGQALRCVGEGHEVRAFKVFSPAVLCGIGSLPGTLYDRSIVIRLARARPREMGKRFDSRHTQREEELCRKISRFCDENRTLLETFDPELPVGLFNRLADNWRPLFAIAEIAGGDWPQRAAAAFEKLTSKEDADAQGIGVMLLSDIQEVLHDGQSDRIFSRDLVAKLCAMTHRPWSEAHRGRSITETWLARRLRSFDVRSKDLRIGKDRAKGYELTDLAEVFARYLSPQQHSTRDSATSLINTEQNAYPERDKPNACHGTKSHESTENIALSRCRALDTPETDESLVVGEI